MLQLDALNLHNGLAHIPTSSCVSLPVNLLSKKTMSALLREIKNTLDTRQRDLVYEHRDNRFKLDHSGGVQLEMVVCPGMQERGVRIRRLSGDEWMFNRVCNDLIAGMNL